MLKQSSPHDQVLHEVMINPYRLCTAEEIADCTRKSINFVLAAKNAGAPFPGGVSRPEWFLAWLLGQGNKFVVKEHDRKPKAPTTNA
jgi:hypothetical protein